MEAYEQQEVAERRKHEGAARLPRELRTEPAGRTAERLDEAKQRMREVRKQASDSLNRAGSAVRSYTRQNPAATSLAAFGAGLGVGLLLAQRRSAARNWRIGAPAIAAIADAVLQAFERRR
jgi:ElaB/YqjD/DUF883 family membrane-anchored ribosome-binding protein